MLRAARSASCCGSPTLTTPSVCARFPSAAGSSSVAPISLPGPFTPSSQSLHPSGLPMRTTWLSTTATTGRQRRNGRGHPTALLGCQASPCPRPKTLSPLRNLVPLGSATALVALLPLALVSHASSSSSMHLAAPPFGGRAHALGVQGLPAWVFRASEIIRFFSGVREG